MASIFEIFRLQYSFGVSIGWVQHVALIFPARHHLTDTAVHPTVKVLWIHNNFHKETALDWNTFPRYCDKILLEIVKPYFPSIHLQFPQCFNFSSSSSGESKFYIEVHALTSYCSSYFEAKVTWYQAAKMCKAAGGTLPVFRDREEMEQFIGLLKLSPYKTVLGIGMRAKKTFFGLDVIKLQEKDPFTEASIYLKAAYDEDQIADMRLGTLPRNSTASPEQLQIINLGLMFHPNTKARMK